MNTKTKRHAKRSQADAGSGQSARRDVYDSITNAIVAQLEACVRPWLKPWSAAHLDGRVTLPLRHNGVAYRGINVIVLWMEGLAKGFAAPRWMTFRQAIELGGCVRKGEKGSLTVYADRLTRTETDESSGEEQTTAIPFMKGYTVFNVEQIDGLPADYYAEPAIPTGTVDRIEHADAFFAATGAAIVHGGSAAFYTERADTIHMPPLACFRDGGSYYATLAHECTHWTKHDSRLARSFGRQRWGDEGYAMEELVAELGAAFLCATLDLTPELREDHASYLASWLKVLKGDKRAIFTAAGHAQRAADFLAGMTQSQPAEAAAA